MEGNADEAEENVRDAVELENKIDEMTEFLPSNKDEDCHSIYWKIVNKIISNL